MKLKVRVISSLQPSPADLNFILVTSEYFSNLGSNGLRLDHMNRPELMHGTVDFDVTDSEIYWASNPPSHISRPFFSIEEPAHGPRKPELLRYMFVLDVSVEAIQSGFVFEACSSLLASLSTNGYPPGAEMAVMTFDSELHFYDLSVRPLSCRIAKSAQSCLFSQIKSPCWLCQIWMMYSFPFRKACSSTQQSICM